ncbi:T9SS type A sorting domain-containing protein [Mangrovivirga cuniculi]|uniref:Secretion system C-terminal sorting domain-containing protein n=1 Tax=Mangrovivirga cuniculi TaxID=2715131 RepID=A0A4D7JTN8_9BACT|nr:T9SS type A sorting domain-containing protein [Mangrovivirga cuniculi]QCK16920.1 hypothetical protein DCC35_20390 [Mangrovivirga cuniculi]
MINRYTLITNCKIALTCILLSIVSSSGYSQCTPVDCLSSLPTYGGICDSSFIAGNVNEAYSDFESFHITDNCFDAGLLDPSFSGTNVRVDELDNINFAGLPNGITGTSNQSLYSSPANGCISVSGTPTEAGEFEVSVSVLVDVTLFDNNCTSAIAPQNDNQLSFPLTLTILPDPSFTIPATSFAVCDEAVSLTITGTAGGTFSGPGVSGNTFDPAAAGAGSHTITYNVSAQEGAAVRPATNSSSITINVTDTPETGIDTQTACDSFTWIDGNTYTESNNTATFNIEGGASNGCDSLVALNLTILNSATGTDTQTACDSFTWIDGNTYTESNNTVTYNIEGGAANGCDSLLTLNLTIERISDLTTTTDGSTITVNNTNVTYQWLDCDNDFAVIPGETNQSFTATENGSYAAQLTKNSCVDTTACITISPLGIVQNEFGNDLKVYPNPTDGNFSIEMGSYFNKVEISIFDIKGGLIRSESFKQQQRIDLALTEKPGTYLIAINADNKKATIRLLKR